MQRRRPTFRSRVKRLVGRVADGALGLDRVLRRRRGRYILAYHRVLTPEESRRGYVQDPMWVTTDTFDAQLAWMQAVGEVVDLPAILDFDRPNDRPLFALTFDDGWADNHAQAFPLLRAHGLTATVFLVTDAVESGHLFWVEDWIAKAEAAVGTHGEAAVRGLMAEQLAALEAPPRPGLHLHDLFDAYAERLKEVPETARRDLLGRFFAAFGLDPSPATGAIMNWDQVREMQQYGIRFGSHGHTHTILKYQDAATVREELATSKRILEEHLGRPVDAFCYPNARYDEAHVPLIREAGYASAFRIHNLPLEAGTNPYLIPRILVSERESRPPALLKLRLLGVPRF